jgi:glycosyltransferase involved in cell wall biosynthesis
VTHTVGGYRVRQDRVLPDDVFQTTGPPEALTSTLPSGNSRAGRALISVVIPALNEASNLPHVLRRMPDIVDEIVLVDGGSSDNTIEVALEMCPWIRVVPQKGRGKGNALRTGFEAAEGEIIVMLDADVSMDPNEIPLFVGALLSGADLAKGSRFLQGGGTADMPHYRRLGNLAFVWMVRALFGGKYSDLCYGYAAFWRDVLPKLNLDSEGFEIETLMNIRALEAGLRIIEVPSFEYRRLHGMGRLRTIPDGFRVLRTIIDEFRRVRRGESDEDGEPAWTTNGHQMARLAKIGQRPAVEGLLRSANQRHA